MAKKIMRKKIIKIKIDLKSISGIIAVLLKIAEFICDMI